VPVAAEAHTENAAVVAASVDEDDLTDGTDGTDPTSVSGSIGFDAGDLITIDYGADGPRPARRRVWAMAIWTS
jgi:hypothetical protein